MTTGPNPAPPYVARVPMLAAAVAFASGIVLARFVYHPYWMWIASAVALAAASLFLRNRLAYVAYASVLAAIACVGGVTYAANHAQPAPEAPIWRFADQGSVVVRGWVMRDGIVREGEDAPPSESVDVAVEEVVTSDGSVSVNGGVRLGIYSKQTKSNADSEDDEADDAPARATLPRYTYGQRIEVTARLHTPTNYKNPGAFDYVGYLRGQDIALLGSAKAETVSVLPGLGGTRFERVRNAARRRVLQQIERVWTGDAVPLLEGMLIGERAFLSRATRTEFQRSGTYHILVVSGMNVAIFAGAIFWLLRRGRAGREWAIVLTVVMAIGYALLTDLGAPVVRSVLMLAIYQLTELLYRGRAALNAVGTAALALLVWDPSQLFEPSFQLTFAAVAAIAGIAIPLFERTAEPYRRALQRVFIVGYDQAFAPKIVQFRLDLRLISRRLEQLFGKWLGRRIVTALPGAALAAFELVTLSLLMQVALALPMVWYFHRLPLRSVAANLLVVPLTGVLMPAAVAAVALSFASLMLAKLPALLTSWMLAGITGTVHLFGGARVDDLRVATPTLLTALLCAACVATAVMAARRHPVVFGAALVLLSASAAWLAFPQNALAERNVLALTAIDVGQGESLLITTPEGKRILLDAGGMLAFVHSDFDVGEEVTSSYLWNRGISRLDAVAFSHAHSDHLQGMKAIVQNFRPRELWLGADADNSLSRELAAVCRRYGVELHHRAAGETFDYGGAHFEVFAPAAGLVPNPKNLDDSSMVLRVSYGATSMLLTGDIHKAVEQQLPAAALHSDLLKIGHHGSLTSTSPEFLVAVNPRYAVISAGVRNQFRHPRPEVLRRLGDARVSTWRTDMFGPVTFTLDGKTVTPSVLR